MSGQIIAKDNDLKIITKLIDLLAEGHEIETSRTFLEIKDASGRAFRYVSMKNRPHESNGKMEQNRIDGAFHNMVERMSDKGKPGTSLHAFLEDYEDDQEEEGEEEEGSDQED
jgi:hypothetical protein